MRIVTVCGMGFGTSLMMKMSIDRILREQGIKAELLAWDLGSAKGQPADIVVAPRDMEQHLKSFKARVILIDNLTNKAEIQSKLMPVIHELQETGKH
ncbi:MAG: PTS sugar transporter subunit IIB [Bacillota bacterium]